MKVAVVSMFGFVSDKIFVVVLHVYTRAQLPSPQRLASCLRSRDTRQYGQAGEL